MPRTTRLELTATQDWLWPEERMARLLAEVLFVSCAAPNQSTFYDRYPYGKQPHERDRMVALKQTVEPMLRRAADLEIDTSIPLDQVVERILDVVLR